MDKEKRSGTRKRIILIVSVTAFIFLVADALLGLWSANEMRDQVAYQFNEEQLVIARNVAGLIERELNFLKKEVFLLREDISFEPFDPDKRYEIIQKSLSRVLESGVWKIEIVDVKSRKTHIYVPYRHWSEGETAYSKWDDWVPPKEWSDQDVWIAQSQSKTSDIVLIMGTYLTDDSSKILVFNVKISWFLTPFLKDIRSGKTGYAWLIDERGIFLFHPKTDFIGRNAFTVREKVHPKVSYGIINSIQKEKMLRGQEGTSWYISYWHRGITGRMKKLIAYCPVVISTSPWKKWSVAVVAPEFEIEEAVEKGHMRQFLLHGMIILVILLGASAIVSFEMRWSRVLEKKVNERTEELKTSEEKYRSLVESAEDFIFVLDSEGHFQSLNSFTANFFGGRPDEFLGKGLSSLFPEEVAEKQLKLVGLVCRLGKSVRDEFGLRLGEHEIWINANFMPLKNEEGRVSSVLCIARDITENKNLERQLVNTEKLASLGTLAAGVAHEINNPLGIMLGFCDLLAAKKDKGTQEYEDLKTIERHGLHCKQIVENLLSFARIGEGISEHSNLNQCLAEILEVVRHTLEINHIELVTELAENSPLVKGDSRELQQVFLNLINNAVAAMKGGGTIAIRTSLDQSAQKAIVQFQDTGFGIRNEDIDHIYEPFFTTKPAGEGTGLGLFVSYGIIKKYGGTIDCASNQADSSSEPSGTTFTLKLITNTREE